MTKEIWKDIVDYGGLYKISNKGRVLTVSTGYIRAGTLNKGYRRLILSKNGVETSYTVHRLVAYHFIQLVPMMGMDITDYDVHHIDGDRLNNNVENLMFLTREVHLKCDPRRIENTAKSQLNHPKFSKKVLCIETGAVYPSAMEASRQTGINRGDICSVCRGDNHCGKTAGGYHWKYIDRGLEQC